MTISPLDRVWARATRWCPRLLWVGTSDEATHIHHALVCVLGSALGGLVGGLAGDLPLGARLGWAAVWLLYVWREVGQWRWGRWPWDAWGDVLVPAAWAAPALLGNGRTIMLLWIASAGIGALYVLGRQRGTP